MEFVHHFMNINESLRALFINSQILSMLQLFTVKPVLRGHDHWDKEKVTLQDR